MQFIISNFFILPSFSRRLDDDDDNNNNNNVEASLTDSFQRASFTAAVSRHSGD